MAQLIEGSKQQVGAWFSYATLVWCLKGTMICFFFGMTAGLGKKRFVFWLGMVCIATWVVVMLTVRSIPLPGTKTSCTASLTNVKDNLWLLAL